MAALSAIDLFAGAGGLSRGLSDAGYRILAANEVDEEYAQTYSHNFPTHPLLVGDIRQLEPADLMSVASLKVGELDLLVGGPPCQGYSIIGQRIEHDPRNDLFLDYFRMVEGLRPRVAVIENVPGLTTAAGGHYLQEILKEYGRLKYRVGFAELLAAQYGTPQMRRRMIFIGFREDLDIVEGAGFPVPRLGRAGIGDLPANRSVPTEEEAEFVNVHAAIADLPEIEAGGSSDKYLGQPTTPYQMKMRQGLDRELFNHYAPRLSDLNLRRIEALSPGQDWRDLPSELLPQSMKRAQRKDHTRRYRRMRWEGVARTVITRFRDPKTGEYIHPEQQRTISIREAARLQGFPDRHRFLGTLTSQYEQVGNAVPVQLAEAIGMSVAEALELGPRATRTPGRISFDLRSQPCLPFDLLDEVSA